MTFHLVLKPMLFYIEVPRPPKLTMTALVAEGAPLTHVNHHETFLSSTKTTKELVVLDRFHDTTIYFTNFACCTDATAAAYVKNTMLDDNSCNNHHGTEQLVDLVAIHCKIKYHIMHWDSLFLALAMALDDCQEM